MEFVDTEKINKQTNQPLRKPQVVLDYNDCMNAVDQFDQNMAYYCFNRKTVKWWKHALTHLIHVSKVQSMIVFNMGKTPEEQMTQFEFTLELVREMTAHIPRLSDKPVDPALAVRMSGRHFPSTIPPTDKKENPTRKCRACTISNKRHNDSERRFLHRAETRYHCLECGKIPLCVDPCFRIYHTYSDYQRKMKQLLGLEGNGN